MKNIIKFFNVKKDEKGSITLFILLAILFFLIVIVSLYYNLSNKNTSQRREIENIKRNYGESTLEEIKEIYDDTISGLEDLFEIKLDNQGASDSGTVYIYQDTR